MVFSLLTLAYSKTNMTYETILNEPNNSLERVIYDKVVQEIRSIISYSLNIYRRKLILKYIYIARTEGLQKLLEKECINNKTYNKLGIWRIALLHSIITYILYDDDKKRLNDIKSMCKMLLSKNSKHMKDVNNRLLLLKGKENIDIYQYISLYLLFGNRLKD